MKENEKNKVEEDYSYILLFFICFVFALIFFAFIREQDYKKYSQEVKPDTVEVPVLIRTKTDTIYFDGVQNIPAPVDTIYRDLRKSDKDALVTYFSGKPVYFHQYNRVYQKELLPPGKYLFKPHEYYNAAKRNGMKFVHDQAYDSDKFLLIE